MSYGSEVDLVRATNLDRHNRDSLRTFTVDKKESLKTDPCVFHELFTNYLIVYLFTDENLNNVDMWEDKSTTRDLIPRNLDILE